MSTRTELSGTAAEPATGTPAPPGAPSTAAGSGRRRKRDGLHGPLMAAPALLGLVLFVGVPFVHAVVLSFFNVRLGSPAEPRFFGVEHYRRLFTDPDLSGPFLRPC